MELIRRRPLASGIIALLLLALLVASFPVVPETKQAVVVRFGKPERILNRFQPGQPIGSAGSAITHFRDDTEDVANLVDGMVDISGGVVFTVIAGFVTYFMTSTWEGWEYILQIVGKGDNMPIAQRLLDRPVVERAIAGVAGMGLHARTARDVDRQGDAGRDAQDEQVLPHGGGG
mgnify:CR=1 FL=1